MIDLKCRNYKKHLPQKRITSEDMCCLGYDGSWDFWLVFEEWEFRIYIYEWWSYDNIVDWEHEWEDWYSEVDNYFARVDNFLDTDSCKYFTVEFVNNNPEGMAYEIREACDNLEDCYSITCAEWDWPNNKLINFIANHIKNKVYLYYE